MTLYIKLFLLIAVTGLIGLTAQDANAKNLSKMLYDSGIEPESLALMQDSAKKLYTASSKSIGDTNEWTNPTTGTNGVVEIVGLKNACVQLFHRVNVARPKKTTEITVWRCPAASGDWQLTANP